MSDDVKKSILIIEDDISLCRGIEYALMREGFETGTANSIADALSLFTSGQWNLILLDVNLPDGNGFDLCREIRRSSGIPIIFLTALDEEVNTVMGLDIGGDDYIKKPFRIKELVSRMNAVLRRTGPAESRAADKPEGFHVDNQRCSVKFKGKDLQLTVTEYKLLNILISNRGNTVTRERLTEMIWDSREHYVDSNTLSVYIKRLREKLCEVNSGVELETIRGTGYRWK